MMSGLYSKEEMNAENLKVGPNLKICQAYINCILTFFQDFETRA